jgi:hypothetical protein
VGVQVRFANDSPGLGGAADLEAVALDVGNAGRESKLEACVAALVPEGGFVELADDPVNVC